MSKDLPFVTTKSRVVAANEAAPETFVATFLKAAGRFRPTGHLAKKVLRELRARQRVPRLILSKLNGRRIALDLDEDVDSKIFLDGAYDKRGLGLIKRVMKAIDCRTAIDVGANIGNHTAYFCDWARSVYAFEPNPPVFERLQNFVTSNDLTNVTIFPWGLSDKNDELPFYVFPGQAHLATFESNPGAVPAGRAVVRSGDSIVQEIGITNIDVIKIDAEEHEYEILKGLQVTLARDRPVIFMEFKGDSDGKFGGPRELRALLEGYRIFGTGRGLMSSLFKTSLRLEPFVYGRYYAHIVCVPESRMAAFARLGLQTMASGAGIIA